jgi:hypothetical protein
MWENQYYIWNPNTGQTEPKTPQTYSYNPVTGKWDTSKWIYSPDTGSYVPNIVSVITPPAGAIINNTAPTPDSTLSSTNNGTPSNSSNNYNLFYNPSISNNIASIAQSGNVNLIENTLAGNARSGNTQAMINLINMLSSTGQLNNQQLMTFITNITGTVSGDINLDPNSIISQATASDLNPNNLRVQAVNSSQINNNILLGSTSGDVAANNNTTVGNATSGNATAIADIVNLIDSAIAANKSFLGVINIYGSLTGNIVIPQNLVDTLLASNAGDNSLAQQLGTNTQSSISSNNNQAINNNIDSNATSGQANILNNTTAGNATSGNAKSNITVLNLTGSNIIGSNALLVFVNVLGNWVGVIMDAPAGATSAALGGGITQNASAVLANTNLSATNNQTINNNLQLNSTSGNATVSGNTTAGNATSGNAENSVNLLNIENSSLSLSNFFGILFVNVFGTWNGSLTNVPSVQPASTDTNTQPNSSNVNTYVALYEPVMNHFKTSNSQNSNNGKAMDIITARATKPTNRTLGFVSYTKLNPVSSTLSSTNDVKAKASVFSNNTIFALVGVFIGSCLLTIERIMTRRSKSSSK